MLVLCYNDANEVKQKKHINGLAAKLSQATNINIDNIRNITIQLSRDYSPQDHQCKQYFSNDYEQMKECIKDIVTDTIKNSQDNPEILEQSMQQATDFSIQRDQIIKGLNANPGIPKRFDVITADIQPQGGEANIIIHPIFTFNDGNRKILAITRNKSQEESKEEFKAQPKKKKKQKQKRKINEPQQIEEESKYNDKKLDIINDDVMPDKTNKKQEENNFRAMLNKQSNNKNPQL